MKPEILLPLLVLATLWLPGHPLMARLAPTLASRCHLPGRVGFDYVLTLVLLAPAMVLAFALQTTVTWICVYYLVISAAALLAMVRSRRRGTMARELRHVAPAGVAVLGADLVLALYAGPYWVGDAPLDIARIRALAEECFSVFDPAIATPVVLTGYHVNVYHGLLAMVSAISASDAIWVWAAALPLAKLLVASAVFFAARSIFRTDRAAWAAVAFAIGALWPISFLHYPNRLAAYWLVTLQLGLVLEIVRGDLPARETGSMLAATALLTGMTHPLVAALAAAAFAPVLAAWALFRIARRGAGAAQLLPVAAASTGLPFALASYVLPRFPRLSPQAYEGLELSIGEGWRLISPLGRLGSWGFGNAYVGVPLLLVACGLLFALGVRRAVAIASLAIVILVASCLYNPLVSTPLLAIAPARWMVYRFGSLLVIATFVLVPGVVASLLFRSISSLPHAAGRILIQVAIVGMALLGHAWAHTCLNDLGWRSYTARRGTLSDLTSPEPQRLQRALRREVPTDAVVLTTLQMAKLVVALHSTNVVAVPVGHTSETLPDAEARAAAVGFLFDPTRPANPALEDALLARYGVGYVLVKDDAPPPAWLRRLQTSETEVSPWRLYAIRTPAPLH